MPLFQIDEDEEVCQDYRLLEQISTDNSDCNSLGERAPCVLSPRTLSLECCDQKYDPENQVIELRNTQSFNSEKSQIRSEEVQICNPEIINQNAPVTVSSYLSCESKCSSSSISNEIDFK